MKKTDHLGFLLCFACVVIGSGALRYSWAENRALKEKNAELESELIGLRGIQTDLLQKSAAKPAVNKGFSNEQTLIIKHYSLNAARLGIKSKENERM